MKRIFESFSFWFAVVCVLAIVMIVVNNIYGVDAREKGMFKSSSGKIKCAVCPECGYTETYIDNPENLKNW